MNLLCEELKSCFVNMNAHLSRETWAMESYISTIKDVEHLGYEDELCDLQADSLSKTTFQENE